MAAAAAAAAALSLWPCPRESLGITSFTCKCVLTQVECLVWLKKNVASVKGEKGCFDLEEAEAPYIGTNLCFVSLILNARGKGGGMGRGYGVP